MNSDLIEKRDERTKRRKIVKRKMDSIIGLSSNGVGKTSMSLTFDSPAQLGDQKARLIDEGYIDNGFVIKKGTLEKFLNGQNQYVRGREFDGEEEKVTEVLNLTDDFVGTVNLGHIPFSILPFELGHWTRSDLSLVDIENDRKALDVDLHLDEDSLIIKELKRQPYDIGISAEFWYHINEEDTQNLSEMLGTFMPVLDEIFIFAYGLVGECGNVNSSGLELKGEETMPKSIEELAANLNVEELEEAENLSVEDEIEVSAVCAEEPAEESEVEPSEEPAEELEEKEEAEETEGEEAEDEEAEEEDGDEVEGEEVDALTEALSIIEGLKGQVAALNNKINELTETNMSLKKTNRKLSGKLQKENERKAEFMNNVKGLSVELFPNEEAKAEEYKDRVADRRYYQDGIGEL